MREVDKKELAELVKRARTCQICGMQKVHHRLYGYRCATPGHTEREHELEFKKSVDIRR